MACRGLQYLPQLSNNEVDIASTDKVALITASGNGMGADAARTLARDGYRVAILSSSGKGKGKGKALAAELGGLGITGSNQSTQDLAGLVDAAMARWGRIDVLVNSAGYITGQNIRVDGGITRSV